MKKDFLSNKFLQLILSLFLLFLAFLFAISFGAEKIKVATLFGGGDKYENIILWQLRLPRVLLVLLTGILLGGSGAVFQMFFRNPLAEPGIMGISAGATLGAVMDVAMSISSTINEIYEIDKTKGIKELFVSGMNVGKDIIGTMANTLILVYMGGSLPLLLLAENIDMQKFINLNQVVTETASALIGSIAIVICVPITALVASQMIKCAKKNEDIDLSL